MQIRKKFIFENFIKKHRLFKSSILGSICNHLGNSKLYFNESELFGLGCGLNFYYYKSNKDNIFKIEFATGIDPNFYKNVSYNMGLRFEEHSGNNFNDMLESLKYNLNFQWALYLMEADFKTISYLNGVDFPYNDRIKNFNPGGALINFIGYDTENIIVCINNKHEIIKIPFSFFSKVDSLIHKKIAYYPEATFNYHWFYVDPPTPPNTETFPYKIMLLNALERIVYKMKIKYNSWYNTGLYAVNDFITYLLSLNGYELDFQKKSFFLYTYFFNSYEDYTKSFYRGIYSEFFYFLYEKFKIYEFNNLANHYKDLASDWNLIINILSKSIDNDFIKIEKSEEELISRIFEKEKNGITLIENLIKKEKIWLKNI